MSNRYDLSGKTALVTGGAGGLGVAMARTLLGSGANVILWDVSKPALERAEHELGSGPRLSVRAVDVTDAAAIQAGVDAAVRQAGRVDALVNNAGILGAVRPLWETDPSDFRRVLEVNLTGAYLCLRAVLPVMRSQAPPNRGRVVNIASIQGKEGMPQSAAYSAAKAGMIGLTKSAAKDVATEGICINCVTPAAVETAMSLLITEQRKRDILGRIPMGRFLLAEELARMVAWLLSDDCSFSTGAVFDLSGGRATY
jgi:2-dehydro-3-deoxy-L-rhamnonate dehydrogenase (NAD+)